MKVLKKLKEKIKARRRPWHGMRRAEIKKAITALKAVPEQKRKMKAVAALIAKFQAAGLSAGKMNQSIRVYIPGDYWLESLESLRVVRSSLRAAIGEWTDKLTETFVFSSGKV